MHIGDGGSAAAAAAPAVQGPHARRDPSVPHVTDSIPGVGTATPYGRDGDRSGLAMLRNSSAWIGIKRDNGATRLVLQNNITMDSSWNTTNTGGEAASTNVSGGRIWLRINADIHPGTGKQARFSYSTDGTNFTSFGPAFTMDNSWQFFMGYRYAIFNYATAALGGSVKVNSFTLSTP